MHTRYTTQTQHIKTHKHPYLWLNLTKTLYKSNVEQKLSACSFNATLHPQPTDDEDGEWWFCLKHRLQAALKRLSVAPSSSVLSVSRAKNIKSHPTHQWSLVIKNPAAVLLLRAAPLILLHAPLIQRKTKKLLEPHRCSKTMPSSNCIFYERNGQ